MTVDNQNKGYTNAGENSKEDYARQQGRNNEMNKTKRDAEKRSGTGQSAEEDESSDQGC